MPSHSQLADVDSVVLPQFKMLNGNQNHVATELSTAEKTALSRHGMPQLTDNMIECYDRNWLAVSRIDDV